MTASPHGDGNENSDGRDGTTVKTRASSPKSSAKRPGASRGEAARFARRRARELALQGLYEWLVSGTDRGLVEAHVRDMPGFAKCDDAHFRLLLDGITADAATLDERLRKHVDRDTKALSPVEHAALLIGAYELLHCLEIPYRVAINEAVELTKSFGGTDGHKYVNGVLDKVALDARGDEVKARRESR